IAVSTTCLSMDLSRATASAICRSSSRLAATVLAMDFLLCVKRVARLQIFVDELVGKDEFRVGDGAKRKSGLAVVGADRHILAVQPQKHAAKPPAAFDGRMEFDLCLMAGPASEIHQSGERPVDAR